ncbi:uncharacterized protein LOC111152328 [Enhydra lutris kenyoni]|uniref:Uncharacterized protein LOC111152328 n=1 Tax=Enhydra lutris kenyoni TaxID=391180 RepID=A0A2Y9JZE4_ENHLU|nr:uncharacterized protein LOC111152328 [Enhydra lutris kenyoni]
MPLGLSGSCGSGSGPGSRTSQRRPERRGLKELPGRVGQILLKRLCVCVCVWTCCLPSIFSFTVKSSQNVSRVCVFWLFRVSTEAGRCHEVSVGRGRSAPVDLPAGTLTGSSMGSARPCGRVRAAGPPSSPLTYHVTLTPE